MIAIKLNAENSTLLDSCSILHVTNISDVYKVSNVKNSAKCNLNATSLDIISGNIDQKESLRNYLKRTNAITKYTYQ